MVIYCAFSFYIWILKPGTYQTSKLVPCIIGIRTEAGQRITAVHCIRGIYLFTCLFLLDYRALFVYVKDKNRIVIPVYWFRKSIFGVLFYLLIRKLILESKTI